MKSFEESSFDNKKIIIFDGECAFCNKSVLFIRKHNNKDNLWYCSSQSTAGKRIIETRDISILPTESLIYIKGKDTFYFSDAALEITKELDHYWAMLSIFLIIPKPIRDWIYRFIAKNRKLILGTIDSCSLENSELFTGRIWK